MAYLSGNECVWGGKLRSVACTDGTVTAWNVQEVRKSINFISEGKEKYVNLRPKSALPYLCPLVLVLFFCCCCLVLQTPTPLCKWLLCSICWKLTCSVFRMLNPFQLRHSKLCLKHRWRSCCMEVCKGTRHSGFLCFHIIKNYLVQKSPAIWVADHFF